MKAENVIQEVAELCKNFNAKEVILYGSRAKGTAGERSDIADAFCLFAIH